MGCVSLNLAFFMSRGYLCQSKFKKRVKMKLRFSSSLSMWLIAKEFTTLKMSKMDLSTSTLIYVPPIVTSGSHVLTSLTLKPPKRSLCSSLLTGLWHQIPPRRVKNQNCRLSRLLCSKLMKIHTNKLFVRSKSKLIMWLNSKNLL